MHNSRLMVVVVVLLAAAVASTAKSCRADSQGEDDENCFEICSDGCIKGCLGRKGLLDKSLVELPEEVRHVHQLCAQDECEVLCSQKCGGSMRSLLSKRKQTANRPAVKSWWFEGVAGRRWRQRGEKG